MIGIKNNIKKISNFLIGFEKDYKLEMWANGEGYDFILDKVIISINDAEYLDFEMKEEQEEQGK